MDNFSDIRTGEVAVKNPSIDGAHLHFIGRVHPRKDRQGCPRQGRQDGPECRIEVLEPWVPALDGVEEFDKLEILYWLDRSRRDLVRQNPRHDDGTHGTVALRSPVRPNPIGMAMARLVRIEGPVVVVRGLDCLDGTPLLDIKPDCCAYNPKAPPKGADEIAVE